MATVIGYYTNLKQKLGRKEAMQKTVDWINRRSLSDFRVSEGIINAYQKDNEIMVEFNDGTKCGISP